MGKIRGKKEKASKIGKNCNFRSIKKKRRIAGEPA
jgi:hypothetical protein